MQDVHLGNVKDEFIEASQDVDVLSKLCPEDLVSVKPEDVSFLQFNIINFILNSMLYHLNSSLPILHTCTYMYVFWQFNFIRCLKECRDLLFQLLTHSSPGNFAEKHTLKLLFNSLALFLSLPTKLFTGGTLHGLLIQIELLACEVRACTRNKISRQFLGLKVTQQF